MLKRDPDAGRTEISSSTITTIQSSGGSVSSAVFKPSVPHHSLLYLFHHSAQISLSFSVLHHFPPDTTEDRHTHNWFKGTLYVSRLGHQPTDCHFFSSRYPSQTCAPAHGSQSISSRAGIFRRLTLKLSPLTTRFCTTPSLNAALLQLSMQPT